MKIAPTPTITASSIVTLSCILVSSLVVRSISWSKSLECWSCWSSRIWRGGRRPKVSFTRIVTMLMSRMSMLILKQNFFHNIHNIHKIHKEEFKMQLNKNPSLLSAFQVRNVRSIRKHISEKKIVSLFLRFRSSGILNANLAHVSVSR